MALWGTSRLPIGGSLATRSSSARAAAIGTGRLDAGREREAAPAAGLPSGTGQASGWKKTASPSLQGWKTTALPSPQGAKAGGKAAGLKRSMPTCWYYEKGVCTNGASCPFAHEGIPETAQANQDAASRLKDITPVCWYYERGCCMKGAACTFKHEGLKAQAPMSFKKLKQFGEEEDVPDDSISNAAKVALDPVSHCEPEEELQKLRPKIAQHARTALQGVDLQLRPLSALMDEFATSLYSKLFSTFGDRSWLPQADLLLLLDAAVRQLIPARVLEEVPPEELEGLLFSTHERVLDEQRATMVVWDAVVREVQGQKTRRKVYKACEAARRSTVTDPEVGLEATAHTFAKRWIERTAAHLSQSSGGSAESALPCDDAARLFAAFAEGGALPVRCMAEICVPEDGWRAFAAAVAEAAYESPSPPTGVTARSGA